mmetsp:Transcript_26879/g.52645  ORF Transcript_26879/g.52645 Transcript_26879/m.52645 type:complete len:492 (-) Transcript_26879:209-1684(-)
MPLQCLRRRSPDEGITPNSRQTGAHQALVTLAAINILNFTDRYIPKAVLPLFQEELNMTDNMATLPESAMVVVFMMCASVFGLLADKEVVDRRVILAGGVALWSAATGLAGLANNFWQLLFFRSLVGAGEAAFATVSSPVLSDFYPQKERNAAFTVIGVAMPLGGALGFVVGALTGSTIGWRGSFLVCGLPGLLAALTVLFLDDPPKGANDDYQQVAETTSDSIGAAKKRQVSGLGTDILAIATNWHWLFATLGWVCSNFALGGYACWYETYLTRYKLADDKTANLILGAATFVAGIGGTLLGAKSADYAVNRPGGTGSDYLLASAIFALPAALFGALSISGLVEGTAAVFTVILLAEIFTFTSTAPISTVSMNVIPVGLRSRSAALQVLLVHILGDVISPPIVGMLSQHLGQGKEGNLRHAMQILWMVSVLSGVWWFVGYRFLPKLGSLTAGKEKDGEVAICELLCSCHEESGNEEASQTTNGSSSVNLE